MYVDAAAVAAVFHGTFETVFFCCCWFGFPSGVCVHKSKIVYITIATVYRRIYETCSLYAIQGYIF